MIANTWLKQYKRSRYTWKAPGDVLRYHIDYILLMSRYGKSVKNANPTIQYRGVASLGTLTCTWAENLREKEREITDDGWHGH